MSKFLDVNPYIPGGGGAQWYGPTNTLWVCKRRSYPCHLKSIVFQ